MIFKSSIIHVHSFRSILVLHYYSNQVQQPKEVKTRLGHSDIKTTMDIYKHITKSSRENWQMNFKTY